MVEKAKTGKSDGSEKGKSRIDKEVDRLRRLRDELNVQAHLGRAEVKELWEKAEHRWRELEAEAKRVRREAREPLQAIGEAGERLVKELETGYERIRKLLK